jgi:hypothetical protein
MDNVYIYDYETFPNFFSAVFRNVASGEDQIFIIYNGQNDLDKLLDLLNTKGAVFIGFNNLDFDYQISHLLLSLKETLSTKELTKRIYNRAQEIINNEDKRKVLIPKWNHKLTELDEYKIMHYNNKARRTSLKWISFSMRQKNIADLPFPHNTIIEDDMVDEIITYNINDVETTYLFFLVEIKNRLKLRSVISKKYGFNAMNSNDVDMGVQIFKKKIAKALELEERELSKLRTHREYVDVKECILPYISFTSKEFNGILEIFKNKRIKHTKGAFNNTPLTDLLPINSMFASHEYKFQQGVRKTVKLVKYDKEQNCKVLEKLNVIRKGFQYDFGAGGIHGCIEPGVYNSDNEYIIKDVDVTSFYPFLSIQNNIYPEHLGPAFCKVYKEIYAERASYPKSTHFSENYALKFALNGPFGKSNSEFSFLFDPKFTMSITINGQLSICMLAESLTDHLEDSTLLQVNTDGLTIKIKRKDEEKLTQLCKEWEEKTKLTLEYADYQTMVIRDVNNYIAQYTNGKFKHKGVFEINPEWHKNSSMRVVPIAIHNYYFNNVPVEETIRNHMSTTTYENIVLGKPIKSHGIYDFCIGKKAVGGYRFEHHYVDNNFQLTKKDLGQKVIRYFIGKKGDYIVKTNGERKEDLESHPIKGRSYKINLFNISYDKKDYNIDYLYYQREANKIINICGK